MPEVRECAAWFMYRAWLKAEIFGGIHMDDMKNCFLVGVAILIVIIILVTAMM